MTLGLQTVLALIMIAIGVYVNIFAANGTIRSKEMRRNAIVLVFVGAGLLVPFPWLAYVSLPWWSAIVTMFTIALIIWLVASVQSGRREVLQKKRRH